MKPVPYDDVKNMISYLITILSLIVFLRILYKIAFNFFYKPVPPDANYRPLVTLIVPVYNEGNHIEASLISCLHSSYPHKEIICVNDGSTDDTLLYAEQTRQNYPGQIKLISFEKNRGKREALAAGIRAAQGEIVVTVDSDSLLEKEALDHIVAPFKRAKIGAVVGHVKVANKSRNFLTRTAAVNFSMSYEFTRTSCSAIKSVLVCSGAFSAYRKSLLLSILDAWLNDTFMGNKLICGDDRALTNFILRAGYDTVYQRNAVGYTLVPEQFNKYIRMIVRWNKSYIVESIKLASFILSPKWKKDYKPLAIINFFFDVISTIAGILGAALIFILPFIDPWLGIESFVLIPLAFAIIILLYGQLENISDFFYGIAHAYFFTFVLVWTLPYAAFTLSDNRRWLTR